jgi:hypothetical protein
MKTDKPHPPMNEGPEAFERFREAAKIALALPKSALPPDPFKKTVKPPDQSLPSRRRQRGEE